MVKLMIFAILGLSFISCVGTVEESKLERTDYVDPTRAVFNYQGIIDARAISHDKIEVDFYAAGSSSEYLHELYVNDSSNPVELQLETIKKLSGDLYRYVLEGLQINTAYKLELVATKKSDLSKSRTGSSKVVRTFDNRTADFKGISTVVSVPGSASSSARVIWNAAEFEGAVTASAYDPVYYEVTYISEAGGAENLNNANYQGSDRQTERVPQTGQISPANHDTSVVIDGLNADTEYYFQVRAIHKNLDDFSGQTTVPIKGESNSVYVSYKTELAGALADFDKDALSLANAPGASGFDSIQAFWSVGEGSFSHYRLFIKEFQGANQELGDELPASGLVLSSPSVNAPCSSVAGGSVMPLINLPASVKSDASAIGCFDIPASISSLQISNLNSYRTYQAKIALCKDNACLLSEGANNQGILGQKRFLRTAPELAPFEGIGQILQPSSVANQISIEFTPFITSQGYANEIKVYCVNPDDHSEKYLYSSNGAALSSTGLDCDGTSIVTSDDSNISTVNNYSDLATLNSIKVNGVQTINNNSNANYCFAISPAITGSEAPDGDVVMADEDLIIRCIRPELFMPTNEEFTGLKGSCSVSNDSVALDWDAPSAGLYDDYSVFYKEKDTDGFSFNAAINGQAGYNSKDGITTLGDTITGLTPGKTYIFGVLPALASGGGTLYGEANVQTRECYVPMPKATFTEWRRIFAIGPKVDGRIPTRNYSSDANSWPSIRTPDLLSGDIDSRMYESLSSEGIPFEVASDQLTAPASYFSAPPGEDDGSFSPGLGSSFDGALGSAGVAASNTGIISLAWEEVQLDYNASVFDNGQDAQTSDRSNRTYGYRVYRSHDYGNSWVNISGNNLVNSIDTAYRTRSNLGLNTPVKMAFFTDYSVSHLYELQDIARARIYFYKIVPVYDGKELKFDGGGSGLGPNVVRVTLPPPNMALVHRKMANRTMCEELGKTIETDNNYVCAYNGVGARPRGVPWMVGQTVADLGGDLLLDRFELGCNYTRGALTQGQGSEYQGGGSFFDRDGVSGSEGLGVQSDNFVFQGLDNFGQPFRGCRAPTWGSTDTENIGNYVLSDTNPYGSSDPSYANTLFGDCIGDNSVSMPIRFDSNGADSISPDNIRVNLPGARDTSVGGYDPTDDSDGNHPQWVFDSTGSRQGLYGFDFRRHTTSQGEFAAVYYNKAQETGYQIMPIGPGYNQSISGEEVGRREGWNVDQKCFINLAAIGNSAAGNPWIPRWFSASTMDRVYLQDNSEQSDADLALGDLAGQTLGDVTGLRTLYDDYRSVEAMRNFKAINQANWNSDRIHPDMTIGRVISSNAAKLPPLTSLNKKTLNSICESYQVQVGLADDNGAFQAMGAPKSKRAIRRNESVAAGKWYEAYAESAITTIESGSSTSLQINGRNVNGCNGNSKNFSGGQGQNVGALIRGIFPKDPASSDGPLLTGSGALDGQDHSESCSSKYGVQDLAGNVSETNSDEVFCDYDASAMGIYFGEDTNTDKSVVYPFSAPDQGEYYIADDAYICYADAPAGSAPSYCPTCTWTTAPGETQPMWCDISGNLQVWKSVNSFAGYCSVADSTSNKVTSPLNFRDLAQVFEPIYNPDGSLNSAPVGREKTADQESVDRMRNGDGFFLNFGETNLGPSFQLGDSLNFSSGSALYFNPVVGVPLACSSYGSNDSCGNSSNDNRLASLSGLWTNHPSAGADPGLPISDFPVGNAQASSIGLSDHLGNTSSFTLAAPTTSSDRIIVRGFVKSDNGNVVSRTEAQGSSSESVYRMRWELKRDELLNTFSGGSYESSGAGAYALDVESVNASRHNDVGSRCAVLINEDN